MNKKSNICKFVDEPGFHGISIRNFVYEKESSQMSESRICDCHIIYIVISGAGKLTIANNETNIKAGNVFFTFKQIPFKISDTENIEYMYISFEGPRSEDLFARFGISPTNCIFEGHENLKTFWENSIAKAGEKNLDLISESVLLYTLGEMAPAENTEDRYLISGILKYLEDNFTECQLNLNTIAGYFGYNSKYISRIFKKSIGMTFSAYLTNLRIQQAIFLIEQNVTSVKNIALLSGYNDPFYFSNVFKTKIGISPKEFIEKHQNNKQ